MLVPEETPLSDDVDFDRLARYEMSGGNIKSVIFRAAASAALRPEGKEKSQIHCSFPEDAVTLYTIYCSTKVIRSYLKSMPVAL